MKCLKCGKETNDHVYWCLEITTVTTPRFAEERVEGVGRYAICDDCVKLPLPKTFGELFKKQVPDAKKSIHYWYPALTKQTEQDKVTARHLLPLDEEELQKICEESKSDRRWTLFNKSIMRLETSWNFRSIIFEKVIETGKWRKIVRGEPVDVRYTYHVDIVG